MNANEVYTAFDLLMKILVWLICDISTCWKCLEELMRIVYGVFSWVI
jgi:hypothetical protein